MVRVGADQTQLPIGYESSVAVNEQSDGSLPDIDELNTPVPVKGDILGRHLLVELDHSRIERGKGQMLPFVQLDDRFIIKLFRDAK